jgi:hypothetical protein
VYAPQSGRVGISKKRKFPWKQPRRPQQPRLRSWFLRHFQCCFRACSLRLLQVQTRRTHLAQLASHSTQLVRNAHKHLLLQPLTLVTLALLPLTCPQAGRTAGSQQRLRLKLAPPPVPLASRQMLATCAPQMGPQRRQLPLAQPAPLASLELVSSQPQLEPGLPPARTH